ncbi:MAG: hypothetical protein RLZZ111_2314 [Planctomycetota bacterium]|jgi:hypothetical protein
MSLSKLTHLPVAALLAAVISVGMPALARLQPKPADDPWVRMRPPLYPVGGMVVFEGKPVVGASVAFIKRESPEREYTALGITDKDGRFWLRTFSSYGDGAVAGTHQIKIERTVPTGRMLSSHGIELGIDLDQIFPPEDAVGGVSDGGPTGPPGFPPGTFLGECGPWIGSEMEMGMGFSAFPGMPETVNVLPARFADETISGLTAEVATEGINEFLIVLHAEPPAESPPAAELRLESQAAGNAPQGSRAGRDDDAARE